MILKIKEKRRKAKNNGGNKRKIKKIKTKKCKNIQKLDIFMYT